MTDAGAELIEVRVVGLSLDAYRTSAAHHDELFREFALVLARPPSAGHEVPSQLLALIERLNQSFSGFTASPEADLQAALERGDATVDLTYRVPRAVRDGAEELALLLARADDYCKQGDLLTVAPPPEAVRFRNWFLYEFIDQTDGKPPVAWSDFEDRRFQA